MLIVGVALAVVVTAWLLLAGFPLLGVVAAVVSLGGVAWLGVRYDKAPGEVMRCLFVLPVDLIRALAPLVLVVLLLTLYATRAVGLGYQLVAALALVAAIALVAGGEWPILKEFARRFRVARRRGRGAVLRLALITAAVLAIPTAVFLVIFLATPLWPGVEEYGGTAAAVQLSGLLLLLGTAVFRVYGFATMARLRPFVAAALLVSAVGIAMIWGFLPGSDGESVLGITDGGWLVLGAAALVAVAGIEADKALRSPEPVRRGEDRAGTPALIGLACAFAGGAAVALALVLVGYEQRESNPESSARTTVIPGTLDRVVGRYENGELANMFAPVLAFDGSESWLPTTVNRFVADASLLDLTGNAGCEDCTNDPKLFELPKECPGDEDSCFILSCARGDGECADGHASTRDDRATIYARVARKSSERDAFRGPLPWRERVTTIVQYWLFYPHNRWRAVTPFGFLTQEHEGDWESVTVGIAWRTPLFVAYSAHCGGEWEEWRKVEVVAADFDGASWRTTTSETGLHPLVAVATGSHANYLGAWRKRPPDWGTCRRIPRQATWALSFASNVRDRTAKERTIEPRVKLVRGGHPAMAFAGRWGRSDVTSIGVFGEKRIGPQGLGPTSPAHKDIWRRPLSAIFCGKHWRGPSECGKG